MARNIKKEYEWEKEKYKRLTIKLDKEYAEDFIKKLKENGYSEYSQWFKEHIEKFMKKS